MLIAFYLNKNKIQQTINAKPIQANTGIPTPNPIVIANEALTALLKLLLLNTVGGSVEHDPEHKPTVSNEPEVKGLPP